MVIKVGELRDIGKEKQLNKKLDFEGYELELKPYISVFKKLEIIQTAYLSTISEDTDVVNKPLFNVILDVGIVDAYTNVNMPKDITEAYDLIVSTGLLELVRSELADEIERLEILKCEYLSTQEAEKEAERDIKGMIVKFLKEIDKHAPSPEELEALSKALKDVEGSEFIKSTLKELDKEE